MPPPQQAWSRRGCPNCPQGTGLFLGTRINCAHGPAHSKGLASGAARQDATLVRPRPGPFPLPTTGDYASKEAARGNGSHT